MMATRSSAGSSATSSRHVPEAVNLIRENRKLEEQQKKLLRSSSLAPRVASMNKRSQAVQKKLRRIKKQSEEGTLKKEQSREMLQAVCEMRHVSQTIADFMERLTNADSSSKTLNEARCWAASLAEMTNGIYSLCKGEKDDKAAGPTPKKSMTEANK